MEKKTLASIKKIDYIIMAVLSIGFFILAMVHLGNKEIPSTVMELGQREGLTKDVVLNFDGYVDLKRIEFFLGRQGGRKVAISHAKDGEWVVINDDRELTYCFGYNDVDINQPVYSLGIVFLDQDAQIAEIFCVDQNDKLIMPNNAGEYPLLFDEQALYPDSMTPTFYEGMQFDEVYHGRTAYEFIHQLPIYENTHPPLGKTIIGLGIRLFGMNPIGWRIVCVIFGALIIPVIYLLVYRMTEETSYAALGGFLLATEFMHYTLSRISTIDIIVATFIMLMFYFMYCFTKSNHQKYLVCCGIASALAVATKWTGIYALAGCGILFFIWMIRGFIQIGYREHKAYWWKLCGLCICVFILLPAVVYLLSYLPFLPVYTDRNLIQQAIGNSKSMYEYHSNVFDSHPYSSVWYQWIINYKPLIDSRSFFPDGDVSVVATFGNPVVYALGLVALVYELYLSIRKRNMESITLLICYFILLGPWILITRTVFIYQYFTCSQILILMICHALNQCPLKKKRVWQILIAVLSLYEFILFYPVLSGVKVNAAFVRDVLTRLRTWMFI